MRLIVEFFGPSCADATACASRLAVGLRETGCPASLRLSASFEEKAPDPPFRSPRLRHYLARLSNAWMQASRRPSVCIFDQAYIQTVAAIALAQPPMDDDALAALLAAAPQCDLAIRIETAEASDAAGRAELARRIETLLRRAGRAVLSLRAGDAGAGDARFGAVEACVLARVRSLAPVSRQPVQS